VCCVYHHKTLHFQSFVIKKANSYSSPPHLNFCILLKRKASIPSKAGGNLQNLTKKMSIGQENGVVGESGSSLKMNVRLEKLWNSPPPLTTYKGLYSSLSLSFCSMSTNGHVLFPRPCPGPQLIEPEVDTQPKGNQS
jgi:hypothetical protein